MRRMGITNAGLLGVKKAAYYSITLPYSSALLDVKLKTKSSKP